MAHDSVRALIDEARRILIAADIDGSALDARLMLQAAAGLRHQDIIADPDAVVPPAAAEQFRRMVARRAGHEPVSRILGEREFYGRVFKVTPAVLDPRPDTETLVAEALRLLKPGDRILDLGTGSGAIIVTLLAECPSATGIASDLSRAALAVAAENAARIGVASRLGFVHGSWFEAARGEFDLIVSNPPYIPLAEVAALEPDVRDFDPLRALDGGPDGLEAYRRIAAGAGYHLASGGHLLVEIGAGQEADVAAIFRARGFALAAAARDLGGHVRCLVFSRASSSLVDGV